MTKLTDYEYDAENGCFYDAQDFVRGFMIAVKQRCPDAWEIPNDATQVLAHGLIQEEADELLAALGLEKQDGVTTRVRPINEPEVVDALCDILYVTFATACRFGIDLAPFFLAVHDANMKKLGGPVREDGKQLKPADWKPAPIAEMLAEVKDRDARGSQGPGA